MFYNIFINSRKIFYRTKILCKTTSLVQYNSVYTFQRNCVTRTKYTNLFNNNCLIIRRCSSVQNRKLKGLSKSEILRLLQLAKPEKWKLLGAVCLLLVSSAVTMAVPFSLGKVLDIIYSADKDDVEQTRSKLKRLCGTLILIFVVGASCNFGRVYIMSNAGYRMTQELRTRVFSAIMSREQRWFDTRSTGELTSRLSSDAQLVGHALSGNLSDGLRSGLAVLAGTGMMVYTSPELATVGLAVVPVVAMGAVIYGRFLRQVARDVQDGLAAAAHFAEERISNVRTVKTFGRERTETRKYASLAENVLNLGYKESLARAIFFGMTGFSGNFIIISVLFYGGAMVTEQTITVGNLTSFLMYAAYVGASVGGLSRFYTELNRSAGAAARLWQLVDDVGEKVSLPSPEAQFLIPAKPAHGDISFSGVSFAYNCGTSPILKDLNLEVPAGKTVAVVGRSGVGKSTLASLLLGLYTPNSGHVTLDGMEIGKLDPMWLRRYISAVDQEPVLFDGTIRDNILYGAPDNINANKEQAERLLRETAEEANVVEFVDRLPGGMNTSVGERGLGLSGGQRQRVAIARALARQPTVLVLDEATSALDAHSERLVRDALARVSTGRTVLIIAHRLSTVRFADMIVVLRDGQVVEKGTYDELMLKKGGEFKSLVEHQAFDQSSTS